MSDGEDQDAGGGQQGGGDILDALGSGGGAQGGGQQGGGQQGGGDAWFTTLSGDAAEGQLSDRAWAENKKFGDVNALVKSARETERALFTGDKVVLPKDGAPPEQVEAFHKAIGRPDAPEGYEIPLPEGSELDENFAGEFRAKAFELGAPAGMAKGLAQWFVEKQAGMQAAADQQLAVQRADEVKALKTEWGGEFEANRAHANRAMERLGLNGEDVGAIEQGFGTKRTIELMAKLGRGMGEDILVGGDKRTMGMTPAEAQTRLDEKQKDEAWVKRLYAKDPAAIAERKAMLQLIAAGEDAAAKRAA